MKILDVTNKNAPVVISTVSYSNTSYTHQGWFTEDKRFFIVGDEDNAIEVDLVGRYQECFDTITQAFVQGVRLGAPFETDRLVNLETLRLMQNVYEAAGVEVSP